MALLEHEPIRFAESLDDYDHISVADVGGHGHTHSLVVRDHRFDAEFEIASHCDYWDFIAPLVKHRPCLSLTPRKEVA